MRAPKRSCRAAWAPQSPGASTAAIPPALCGLVPTSPLPRPCPPPLPPCSKQRRRLLSDGDQRQQQQLEQQRLEAEERRHTAHAAWGALAAGSRQFLLAHRAGLTAGERAALVEHIEGAAGCTVAHYVPDHALLVVGPAGAEAALEAHPHVLWLVR